MHYECACPLQDYINFRFKASGIIVADVDNFLERIEPAGAEIRDPAAAVRNSDVAPPRDHSDMRAIAPPTNGSSGQPLRPLHTLPNTRKKLPPRYAAVFSAP
jgi:hypothetical protein